MPTLYERNHHEHIPRDPNQSDTCNPVYRFNTRIAFTASAITSSVWCFYFFLVISLTGFPGIPWVTCTPQQFTAWFSSQFLQLILLPLIAYVASQVGKKQEMQAQEQYQFILKTYHDTEEIHKHADAQDQELMRQSESLRDLSTQMQTITDSLNSLHIKVDNTCIPVVTLPGPKRQSRLFSLLNRK